MPQIQVQSILWRKINQATIDTLTGASAGQYDIRLNKNSNYPDFFNGLAQTNPNANGGFEIIMPFEAVGGTQPLNSATVSIKFMGPTSARQDWIISSQRPNTAYPAWQPTVAVPGIANATIVSTPNYVVILKDINNRFHARWVDQGDFNALPSDLQASISATEHGVLFFENHIWSTLSKDIYAQLIANHNILLYGPPGTGKSHLLQELINLFSTQKYYSIDTDLLHNAIQCFELNKHKALHNWVTFHQSYSYEEFVISLKPNPSSTKLLSLEPVPGTLLDLAEFARVKGNASLMIIDEINRGNVSRIFGEFITLLEPDKRLNNDNKEHFGTVKLKLPYLSSTVNLSVHVKGSGVQLVPNPYTMPYNVFLVATMNSVDRSTTPIDAALRRRFHVINIKPDLKLLAEFMGIAMPNIDIPPNFALPLVNVEQIKLLALYLLRYLNNNISQFLGQDYLFGQWYFKGLKSDVTDLDVATEIFANIWSNQIYPQLEEYFNGRIDQLINVLKLHIEGPANAPIKLNIPSETLEELGANPILQVQEVDNLAIITYVNFLVSANT